MILDKKFQELSKELENTKRKKNMLEGELIPLKKDLKELGLDSLEAANNEKQKLIGKRDRLTNRVQELLEQFEEEFGGSLDL